MVADVVDYDMCWAYELTDPWGNLHELNCDDYQRIREELVEADAVTADRKWPREVYEEYLGSAPRVQ